MSILVLGGAGYIGSHMVAYLQDHNIPCVVLDNLTTGFRESVPLAVPFVEGDFSNRELLSQVFEQYNVSAVMHFAAYSQVGESMNKPGKYFTNNFGKTQVLLDTMLEHNIKQFVFSSTAAVYGNPVQDSIDEQHPVNPINPYGHSKMAVEWMLHDYAYAHGLQVISLRYFNAAGAQPDASNGERHDPETHLIPLILQAASGRRDQISIFGTDYPTDDGSCIRDYIHIVDLAQAHLLALKWLQVQSNQGVYESVNLGNGAGYSVKEVVAMVKQITGLPIKVVTTERRVGDPAVLVASAAKAKVMLGWCPEYPSLHDIVAHAWAWEEKVTSL